MHPGVWVVRTDLDHLLIYRGRPRLAPDGTWSRVHRIERFCELSLLAMGWHDLPRNEPVEVCPLTKEWWLMRNKYQESEQKTLDAIKGAKSGGKMVPLAVVEAAAAQILDNLSHVAVGQIGEALAKTKADLPRILAALEHKG